MLSSNSFWSKHITQQTNKHMTQLCVKHRWSQGT
jgi:hypothetical protein